MSPRQRAIQVSSDTKTRMHGVTMGTRLDITSKLITPKPLVVLKKEEQNQLRCAIIAGDFIDIALDWNSQEARHSCSRGGPNGVRFIDGKLHNTTSEVLLLSPCSESTPGGDWLSGVLGPEESLARRSNLVQSLSSPSSGSSHYPLPAESGIYSRNVVVFREGPLHDDYSLLDQSAWSSIPVLSVSPVKRPRLDDKGRYAFQAEREAQKEKIRLVLRSAAELGHVNLCLGAFGATVPSPTRSPESDGGCKSPSATQSDPVYGGAGRFRNPLGETVELWREVVLFEDEFQGYFSNIIFAVQPGTEKEWTDRMHRR